MRNGSFYHLPQQDSRRNPAKRFRREEDERQRARVLPLAAGRGIRRPLGRRPASHLSGLRRSRCPAKCTGRGMAPHPQAAGRSPHPLLATIGEKHEKRYQIQHAHGVRRPGEDQGTGGEGPHVHERLCHRLLSRQADRRHRRAKKLLRQLKGIGSNINRLTVLANMGKVQVIGLEKAAGELSEVSAALRAVMEGR